MKLKKTSIDLSLHFQTYTIKTLRVYSKINNNNNV